MATSTFAQFTAIAPEAIAVRLGIKPGNNGKYHCPNIAGHRRGDKNASLSIGRNMFNCFACGIHGNYAELIKVSKNTDTPGAFRWLEHNFGATGQRKRATGRIPVQVSQQRQMFLDPADYMPYLQRADDNLFFRELVALNVPPMHFGGNYHVSNVYWPIGNGRNGETQFYYINIHGRYTNAKAITFGDDLKRDRQYNPRFIKSKKDGYSICLYGEHNLSDSPDKPVRLVESEKTAIIASYCYPSSIWIATGGTNGLTSGKAQILSGRKVFIHFDADEPGRQKASDAQKLLTIANIDAIVKDMFPNRSDGYDLADYLLGNLRRLKIIVSTFNEQQREIFEERAAILQYMALIPRYQAEIETLKIMGQVDAELYR